MYVPCQKCRSRVDRRGLIRASVQRSRKGRLAGRQGRAVERDRHTTTHTHTHMHTVVLLETVPSRKVASARACVQFRILGVSLSRSHLYNIRCVGFVCHQQQLLEVGVSSLARDELWVCRANVGGSFAVLVLRCRNAPGDMPSSETRGDVRSKMRRQ